MIIKLKFTKTERYVIYFKLFIVVVVPVIIMCVGGGGWIIYTDIYIKLWIIIIFWRILFILGELLQNLNVNSGLLTAKTVVLLLYQ